MRRRVPSLRNDLRERYGSQTRYAENVLNKPDCSGSPRRAQDRLVLESTRRWHVVVGASKNTQRDISRNHYLFAFLSASLCVGVSHADTIQRRVAAGVNHSLTVKEDGTLWAWGSNDRGQLGIGSTVDQWVPAQG